MSSSRYSFRACALLTTLLLLPVLASAQGRSVTGTYNTTINSPQGSVKAVIVLKRDAGAFSGTLAADGFPTIPVTNVVPSDSGVSLQGDSPDGAVLVKMKFGAADKVTGTVVYQGAEMTLDGTFASGAAVISAAGTYELKSTEPLLGMAEFPVTCAITSAADGSYSGTCGNDQGGAPVGKIVVDGSVVTMTGDSPAGPFKAVITIDGKSAMGTLQLGTETAKMKGTFTPK
jgi:hypothetical protein